MRPIQTKDYHTAGTAGEAIEATIDAAHTVHVMTQLSDIYSDRILAVEREYSTNAYDSHVAAGVSRPIEVTLPTEENPTFVVEDFGLGLGIEDLRHVYLSYGSSDKRDSDDLVGALGFGSKAASAYAPLGWQVEAVKDGEKVIATVAKSPEGVPTMHVIHRGPTAAPNGVKISVPVEDDDVDEFRDTADAFYAHWAPGTVLVDGTAPESIFNRSDLVWVDDDVALSTNRWQTQSTIIMGNVGYPLDRRTAWGHAVVANVPMGSVEFTPSRESLKMSDYTKATLDTLFDYANHYGDEAMVRQVTEAESSWAAVNVWARNVNAFDYATEKKYRALVEPHLPAVVVGVPAFSFRVHTTRGAVTAQSAVNPHTFDAGRSSHRIGIIEHYPFIHAQDIATTRRYHMRQWANHVGVDRIVVLGGDRSSIGFLDGWAGDSITWAEVVENYPRPKVARGSGAGSKTVYDRFHGGGPVRGLAEKEWNDLDEVVLYSVGSGCYYSRRHPEAHVAEIKSTQVDKFLRLHPTALNASTYDRQRIEFVTALVDEEVKMARWGGAWNWMAPKKAEVADPEVVALIEAVSNPSDVAKECERLSIHIPEPDAIATLDQRYPLIRTLSHWEKEANLEELVIYMNAKYEQVAVAELLAEIEDAEASIEEVSEDG